VLAAVTLPWISNLTGVELTLAMANHGWVWTGLVLLLFADALVAGSYPSLVLSGFRPARVFSGGRSAGARHAVVRKLLVGMQVVATFALILGSFLFLRQMDYVRSKRLGFNQEQVVTLPRLSGWDQARYNAFKQAAETDPAVLHVTLGEALGTGRRHAWGSRALVPDGPKYPVVSFIVGRDFIETMGLQLVAGDSFRNYDGSGSITRLIVTESYARALEPNGDVVGYVRAGTRDTTQVVGVVADFQNRSLHSLSPTDESGTLYEFELTDYDDRGIAIPLARLAPGQTSEGLRALKTAWERLSPERPFQFEFLDDLIQAQYTSERRLAGLFGVFAGLSILIACLGLFGLAAFSAEQRTKEIGIRKALGATARGIVLLLARDYVAIVLAGVVVAIPLVLILGSEWLQNFSDHISIGPGLLLSATAAVLGFVLLAVGYQSVKAALSNPTDALRHE
jgi:putative ABC transport system permease protein